MHIDTSASDGRDIAPPAHKRPLRTNVFDYGRGIGSALLPMFPYQAEGDLLPCLAVFRGGAKHEGSTFEHTNTVDEIVITYGSRGSFLRVGQVYVGEKKHTVGSFLPKDPQNYVMMTVIQRQAERGLDQHETVTIPCQKCSTPLLEHHYPARALGRDALKIPQGYTEPLMTLVEGAEAVAKLNTSEPARTCRKCGHVNPPFPVGTWHWDIYDEQSWCVDQSLMAYGKESAVG